MSTVAVSAGHIRVNDSNANAGWGNYNKGGGAPAAEGQNAYQGGLAVNTKVNSTNDREGVTYDAGTAQDPTGKLILLKATAADYSDLNTTFGMELAIGSAEGAHWEYNVAGSSAPNDWFTQYNSVGGVAGAYLFVAIDTSIAGWRAATIGSPAATAIDFYAVGCQFVSGQAKSENVALDAIDIGNGLTYTGAAFSFADAVAEDQDITTNRWGWAAAVGSIIFLRGLHEVSATGVDSSTVVLPDGYHSTGLAGFSLNSTSLELAGSYECLGRDYPGITDTRGDLTVAGSGEVLSGSFKNWRLITLNSTAIVTGDIEAAEITQGGAQMSGATIRTASPSGVATIDDPTFANLAGTTFIQSGDGYAIEITTPGTYVISDIEFNGYAAAIYNNSGGAVTLNVTGATPSVDNGTGASTQIVSATQLTLTGLENPTEVRLFDSASPQVEVAGDENVTTGTYTASVDSATYPAVNVAVIHGSGLQNIFLDSIDLTSGDVAIPIQQQLDRQYENP